MASTKHTVVTIKWGSAFGPDEVNILFNAVTQNTSYRPRFLCLTDNPDGLLAEIESRPIPTRGLREWPRQRGQWPKICLFHPDLCQEFEQALYLDLDTVVVGKLDPFFENPGRGIKVLGEGLRWQKFDASYPTTPNTSVFCYKPQHHLNIFCAFRDDPHSAYRTFLLEQEFIGATAKKIEYFPVEWIESFKYHLRQPPIADLVFSPRTPKSNTRIVAFHGFPKPKMLADRDLRWAKFPRAGLHRPEWILEYYERYGIR